jgi:hypothetical protein
MLTCKPHSARILWRMCTVSLLLSACTVSVPYPLGIAGRQHVTVAMTPSAFSAPVHKLSDIRNIDPKHPPADGSTELRRDLTAVRDGMDTSVQDWLHGRQYVQRVDAEPATSLKAALAQARQQGADLLLAVDVSGYGHIKRRWIAVLFGSGVIEGVTQGAAATAATGNPALGIGVGLEEVASEGLTWIGGSWFWGKYFAPVTLEGRMWSVRDGRLIWDDIEFADNSDQAWRLLTRKPMAPKSKALATSLASAEKAMFTDLGRYLRRDVLIHWRHTAVRPDAASRGAAG